VENWIVEDGSEFKDENSYIYHAPVIENKETDTLWYSRYFITQEHQNYVGNDETYGPYVLSVLKDDAAKQYRCILWLPEGTQTLLMPFKPKQTLTSVDILRRMNPNIKKKPKHVTDSDIQKELLIVEEQKAKMHYKFGVLYMKSGQTREEEMFRNTQPSAEFQKFLSLLGDKITLKGWTGFSGGLDVKGDRTGKHSIWTQFSGYEIMFHVSTMLPFEESDPQQVERKKHIGNDIVVIIFQDSDCTEAWNPTIISSKFNHIHAVVRPCPEGYRLALARRDCVKAFGPPLPNPPVFTDDNIFKDFLLAKLINAEREAIRSAPNFKTSDILHIYLKAIYEKFSGKERKIATSQSFRSETPIVDLLNRADSTDPQQNNNNVFTVRDFLEDFSPEIFSCGVVNGKLLLGTNEGLFLLDTNRTSGQQQNKPIKIHTNNKKYTQYVQIEVVSQLGIVVTLLAKEGIIVYDMYTLEDPNGPREFKVRKTKGVTRFALGSLPPAINLALCTCGPKGLSLYKWEADTFQLNQTFILNDIPKIVDFWNDCFVVGLSKDFCLLNPSTRSLESLYAGKAPEMVPLDVIILEDELLLCFTNFGCFVNKYGTKTRPYDIFWGSIPHQFVYFSPYVMVFTATCIEVRTMVNGSLIQTIYPRVPTESIRFLTSHLGLLYCTRTPEDKAKNRSAFSNIYQIRLQGQNLASRRLSSAERLSKRRTISSPLLIHASELSPRTGELHEPSGTALSGDVYSTSPSGAISLTTDPIGHRHNNKTDELREVASTSHIHEPTKTENLANIKNREGSPLPLPLPLLSASAPGSPKVSVDVTKSTKVRSNSTSPYKSPRDNRLSLIVATSGTKGHNTPKKISHKTNASTNTATNESIMNTSTAQPRDRRDSEGSNSNSNSGGSSQRDKKHMPLRKLDFTSLSQQSLPSLDSASSSASVSSLRELEDVASGEPSSVPSRLYFTVSSPGLLSLQPKPKKKRSVSDEDTRDGTTEMALAKQRPGSQSADSFPHVESASTQSGPSTPQRQERRPKEEMQKDVHKETKRKLKRRSSAERAKRSSLPLTAEKKVSNQSSKSQTKQRLDSVATATTTTERESSPDSSKASSPKTIQFIVCKHSPPSKPPSVLNATSELTFAAPTKNTSFSPNRTPNTDDNNPNNTGSNTTNDTATIVVPNLPPPPKPLI
jgi:hypothetical protein